MAFCLSVSCQLLAPSHASIPARQDNRVSTTMCRFQPPRPAWMRCLNPRSLRNQSVSPPEHRLSHAGFQLIPSTTLHRIEIGTLGTAKIQSLL